MKHEVRKIFAADKVETVRLGFGISVGVAVPQKGKLYPLPPGVVRIVPYFRSCEYFRLADDRIVIVDPINLQIA